MECHWCDSHRDGPGLGQVLRALSAAAPTHRQDRRVSRSLWASEGAAELQAAGNIAAGQNRPSTYEYLAEKSRNCLRRNQLQLWAA